MARLLRADNLQELSPADIATLVGEIGLTTVVDLRSSDELASEGPAPLDGVAGVLHVHHPVLPEAGSATDAATDALLTRADRDRSRYPADPICGHYLGYLEDRPDQVAAALRSVAQAQGAALVHCAAGKDRTGVVVAVALSAAGVRRAGRDRRLRRDGRADRAILRPPAQVTDIRDDISGEPADVQRPRPRDHGGVPGAAGLPLRRGRPRGWPGTASAPRTCSCSAPSCSAPERARLSVGVMGAGRVVAARCRGDHRQARGARR